MLTGKKKTLFEIGLWVLLILVLGSINTFTKIGDLDRFGISYDLYREVFNETTGMVSIALLIPLTIAWLNRFPLNKDKWATVLATHLVGGFLFGICHVIFMTLFRTIGLDLIGQVYAMPQGFNTYMWYEIRKAFPMYLFIIMAITAYRYYLANLADGQNGRVKSDKLLVKTRNGEELIARSKIDWLKAAANYVELHVGEREYLVRTTLSKLNEKLASDGAGGHFVRVHKSFIVNLDRIVEITPTESGDFRIKLTTGADIPLSRRYRENLDMIF